MSVRLACTCFAMLVTVAPAAETLRGQYLEARTCDIYTGACFANAEMGLAGKEAVLAWRVDSGSREGVALEGLCVAVVLKGDGTIGDDGVFPMHAEGIRSVILVDERGDAAQRQALEAFARETASRYTANVQQVLAAPMSLDTNHATGAATFSAGRLASIPTRAMGKLDCGWTNGMGYYQPLPDVRFADPVYALSQAYQGPGLNGRWTLNSTRSAFLGTFRSDRRVVGAF